MFDLSLKVYVQLIICTELYKEIDWISDFEPAYSGQSGLKSGFNCNVKPGLPEYAG